MQDTGNPKAAPVRPRHGSEAWYTRGISDGMTPGGNIALRRHAPYTWNPE